MKHWHIITVIFFGIILTVSASGQTDPTIIEHSLIPHWRVTRLNVEFDLSPGNILAVNGQSQRLFIEIKKIEEQGERLVEIPLAQFELGPSDATWKVGSYGGPVQAQTLKGPGLKERDVIKVVIRQYAEHLLEKSDRVVGRVMEKISPKKKTAPREAKIFLEETFSLL